MSKHTYIFFVLISSLLLMLFVVSCSEESPVSQSVTSEDLNVTPLAPPDLAVSFGGAPGDGDEGCTPGYWKNHLDSWPGSPNTLVNSKFPAAADYPELAGDTLLDALNYGGGPGDLGAAKNLLRAAVAALLNAKTVDFHCTAAEVREDVNVALSTQDRDAMLDLKDELDEFNNLGCPLN